MASRKSLISAVLALLLVLSANAVQVTTVGAQCRLTWQDVFWPEESACRTVPASASDTAAVSIVIPAPPLVVQRTPTPGANDNGSNDDGSNDNDGDTNETVE